MRIISIFLIIFFFLPVVQGAEITLSGNWSESISRNDLVSGAGSDIRSPIESSAGQAILNIVNTTGGNWTVKVSKNQINWPTGVSLAVKRTSNGMGTGTISGGTVYLTLDNADQIFFTGSGDRNNIELQFKTEALSIRKRPDVYNVTIIYTIE